MNPFAAAGLPEWKTILLVSMTLIVIAASHVHSARAAWAEMRSKHLPSRWRQVISFVARHEYHYGKRVPLMIVFVIVSVAVVVQL